MKLELVKREADGAIARCTISCEADTVTTTTEAPGKKARARSKAYPSAEKARAAAHKAIAKLVLEKDYVAASLAPAARPLADVAKSLSLPHHGGGDELVLIFEGDCHVPHDLLLDFRMGLLAGHGDGVVAGVYVAGDLRVDGCVVNWEDDFGPFLYVGGSMQAHALATGGAELWVGRDLRVAGEIVGVYNHGYVRVAGDLSARAIATEHTVEAKGRTDAVRYDGWYEKAYRIEGGVKDVDDPYDLSGVFNKALIREQRLDLREARKRLSRGKAITLATFTSVRAHFRKLLGKKLEAPEKVKTINLSMKDLTSLPDEVVLFANLRRLELTHNKLRELPPSIAKLTALEELCVSGNGLQRVPDEIGELCELRLLDLSSNCLVALPDALARCQKLEVVNLTNNPYSYVRSSFGSWDNARLMWDFPEVLTRLPRLRKLSLDQTFVRALPARAFDSEQLEPLTIKRTLITEADAALHPKIAVDVASSYEKAVDYIGYWFDGVEDGLREQLEQCDWSDAQALLALLLRINVPISAPYDKALARFDKEIEKVCRRLRWAPEQAPHLRSLFAALGEAVDVFAAERGENALVAGLRQRFAEQARE